jgi:hypothetical protein
VKFVGCRPLDFLLRGVFESAILANYAKDRFDEISFPAADVENFLLSFDSISKMTENENENLLEFCGFAVRVHGSRSGVRILRFGLSAGRSIAGDIITSGQLPRDLCFSELVNGLRPGEWNELYINVIGHLLCENTPVIGFESMNDESESDIAFSDSGCDSFSDSTVWVSESNFGRILANSCESFTTFASSE